jgi:arabinose-5-phosphate isomerase
VFEAQAAAVAALGDRIGDAYLEAVELILMTRGRVVVTGMGKSGIVGRKISATLASTGTPSFFLHPADALHGDLGAVTSDDLVLMISCSGETEEALRLLPCFQDLEVPIVALVGVLESTLGRQAHAAIDVSVQREVCPHNLAPTTSAMAALAMGDALAVSLMRRRDFRPEGFARVHPGGRLAKRAQPAVKDLMRLTELPRVSPDQSLSQALVALSEGRLGFALVYRGARLMGALVASDVRAALRDDRELLQRSVSSVMRANVPSISKTEPFAKAKRIMQRLQIETLVVVDEDGKPCGVVDERLD